MRRIPLTLVMILVLASQAHAGEIIVQVPEEPLQRITWLAGFMHRAIPFSGSPAKPEKELFTKIIDFILPIVSQGKVSKLSLIPAELLVMKDSIIIQIPDERLRGLMEDAYGWMHLRKEAMTEQERINAVADYVVVQSTRGIYKAMTEVPATVSVRFDDPKYERE